MSERQPKSTMVRRALKRDISEGIFVDKLPSMNMLARRYGVARLTVRAELKKLQEEGILTIRQGSGTTINMGGDNPSLDVTTQIVFPFSQAVARYMEFLANPNISSNTKNRMIHNVDSQMIMVMEVRGIIS
jgi:DNA-binding GntR family transcriptional regulator